MKKYEDYKKENTAPDWIIRDIMIELNRLRSAVITIGVGLFIAGVIGIFTKLW